MIADLDVALQFHLSGLRDYGIDDPDMNEIAIREIVETRELLSA